MVTEVVYLFSSEESNNFSIKKFPTQTASVLNIEKILFSYILIGIRNFSKKKRKEAKSILITLYLFIIQTSSRINWIKKVFRCYDFFFIVV